MSNKQKKIKWSAIDIVLIILEISAPIISIVITCVLPQSANLSTEVKLSIITAGITIPIVILQATINNNHKKVETDIDDLKEANKVLAQNISPTLEKVFLSDNDRLKRFVFRRINEVYGTINNSINNNNSGELRPNEYYEELLHLAELILEDKKINRHGFAGEIWAMTSFADEEWIADAGYEKLWTEKLLCLAQENIPTKRLCLISNNLYNNLFGNHFSEEQALKYSQYAGFLSLLKTYYGNSVKNKCTQHYIITESDSTVLNEKRGFFAIKLTNGEYHILCGETVDENGALTASLLFDSAEIHKMRKNFERLTTDNRKVNYKIVNECKSNGFIDCLNKNNIRL